MKIDVYAHFITEKVIAAFVKRVGNMEIVGMRPDWPFDVKVTCDVAKRIEILQKYPGLVQVLTPTGQPIECFANPKDTVYLTKLYNDELAGLIARHPDSFIAAVAAMPMNDIREALKEIDRVINELGFKGILISTPINGKPMDLPEYFPIYERMSSYDLPIWIHPTRLSSFPDYTNENTSKYGLYHALGWPYETSIAMGRLVCSGILTRYPNLKFITHHAGAMIPFLAGRISQINPKFDQEGPREEGLNDKQCLVGQFQKFYNDTAIYGNTPALMCAQAFFGTDHLLFGTDMPYGPENGETYLKATLDAIDGMSLPDSDKIKIYEQNARDLLKLS